MGKKLVIGLMILSILTLTIHFPAAAFTINARAAVLMDPESGRILYNQNGDKRFPPASVTKVMTMLLIMEAIHAGRVKWTDSIITSTAASGMGGSQVFLKEGETLPLRDMFKAIAVVSANDASAAVAEYLYGSLIDFIEAMNRKARALGLKNTHFANETGLPDPDHYSSAHDLAVMSRELLKYPEVLTFTSIWLDSLRDGKFILRNTNELIKVYPGADGLKTGHTAEAKFCLSATANKDGFRLLSVILGAASDGVRVAESKRLLDYGYRTFEKRTLKKSGAGVGEIYLADARPQRVPVKLKNDFALVLERGKTPSISTRVIPLKKLKYPIPIGQRVGDIQAIVPASGAKTGKVIGSVPVYSSVKVKQANFLVRWWRALVDFISGMFKPKDQSRV